MPRPRITDRHDWPEIAAALRTELASGRALFDAANRVGAQYKVAGVTLCDCIRRGDVEGVASPQPDRAEAWLSGKTRYEGSPCRTCGETLRYCCNDTCVACEDERNRQSTGSAGRPSPRRYDGGADA